MRDNKSIINDVEFQRLLLRHFDFDTPGFQVNPDTERDNILYRKEDGTARFMKRSEIYRLISDCHIFLISDKGHFALVDGCVIFIDHAASIYVVSKTPYGLAAALTRSSAFISRCFVKTNMDAFLDDVRLSFCDVRDWAAHAKDAQKAIKSKYDIPYLDDF